MAPREWLPREWLPSEWLPREWLRCRASTMQSHRFHPSPALQNTQKINYQKVLKATQWTRAKEVILHLEKCNLSLIARPCLNNDKRPK